MKKEKLIVLMMLMTMSVTAVYATESIQENGTQVSGEAAELVVPKAGDFLYQTLQDENLNKIDVTLPVEIQFHIDQGGGGSTAVLTEQKAIQEAVELFKKISIKEETYSCVTDNYNWVSFIYDNGEQSFISLNLENLELKVNNDYHYYELKDLDGFWKYMSEYLISDYEREQEETKLQNG